jgi:adenylosuccinate lyase
MAETQRPKKMDVYVGGEGGDKSTSPVGVRYGRPRMTEIWGGEGGETPTVRYITYVEKAWTRALSNLYPEKYPRQLADEIEQKCIPENILISEVRKKEGTQHHREEATFATMREAVSQEAGNLIHLLLTSADDTETQKALQIKDSLEILIPSLEETRDVGVKRAYEWGIKKGLKGMQVTHKMDALAEAFGRPLIWYSRIMDKTAQRLFEDLNEYIVGKFSDMTGNYHSATALKLDGMKLEEESCRLLGIAPWWGASQITPREFYSFIVHDVANACYNLENMMDWIAELRGSARSELQEPKTEGQIGSSTAPHKDLRGGNPISEERTGSISARMQGNVTTMDRTVNMPYARNLKGSLSDRITLGETFVLADYACGLAKNMLERIQPDEYGIEEGLERSYRVTTAQRFMNILIDNGMNRDDARRLSTRLAAQAFITRTSYTDILLGDSEEALEIAKYLTPDQIREYSDPRTYLGESAKIIQMAYDEFFEVKEDKLVGKRRITQST